MTDLKGAKTPLEPDGGSWMERVGGYACITDAMCYQFETHTRITSCRSGSAVDISTVTLSHVGLAEPWKNDGSCESAGTVVDLWPFQTC